MSELKEIQRKQEMTPGKKALHTAKWARIMTKWLITFRHKNGASWRLVEFGGRSGAEARGIVDVMAIRKNHTKTQAGLKKGDLFDIVLIQTKGGSATRPTAADTRRLQRVGRYYRAKAVVLAEWRKGERLNFYRLEGSKWSAEPVAPGKIFI